MTSTPPARSIGQFIEYFDDRKIISYLCRVRATLAQRRGKIKRLSEISVHRRDSCHNELEHFQVHEHPTIETLGRILPPRKQWVSIGERSRKDAKRGDRLGLRFKQSKGNEDEFHMRSSLDRNRLAIEKTVWKHLKSGSKAPFVQELKSFIAEIRMEVLNGSYVPKEPLVIAAPKKDPRHDPEGSSRPIALYGLKDRIVFSLANRYLTDVFDKHFLDCAFAFRGRSAALGRRPSHHDAFQRILAVSAETPDAPLWIAECDIQKFYDSVLHAEVRKAYAAMVEVVRAEQPELDFTVVTRILESYLSSYAFNDNVLRLGNTHTYYGKVKRVKYGWVASQLSEAGIALSPSVNRIGVPQGGALSGLIANLVFHETDKKMMDLNKGTYVRYCDDMVILATTGEECASLRETYEQSVRAIGLIIHEFKPVDPGNLKTFWETKSKGPFSWGNSASDVRWIGFVGYEANRDSEVRARRTSIRKEIRKQRRVVRQVRRACGINAELKALRRGDIISPSVPTGAVLSSVCQSLTGMAVGRVQIWNRAIAQGDLSWRNGFRLLGEGTDVREQMIRLDRTRNALVYKLQGDLELRDELIAEQEDVVGDSDAGEEEDEKAMKDREMVHFDKPFSYFYHVVERRSINDRESA